ncbi:MAG: aminotransferase class I/II-fold pyridoxal phosphate-dependent enzyme, partial [Pyrinomonadaceae bacterium]
KKEAFFPCYGMAESTLIITGRRGVKSLNLDTEALTKNKAIRSNEIGSSSEIVNCGSAVEELEVAIVDSLTGNSMQEGEINEIWVSGPNIANGYWNMPELSKDVFSASLNNDGRKWLKTGDLGFIYENQLYISGRQKDLIIIRGKNFYPQDIESLISQNFSEIKTNNVAAFSFKRQNNKTNPAHSREEQFAIVCELDRKAYRKTDFHQLCLAINQLVVSKLEITPYSIILIRPATMPKTTSGKIRRFECRNNMLNNSLPKVYEWQNPVFHRVSNNGKKLAESLSDPDKSQQTLEKWMLNYLEQYNDETQPHTTSRRFEDVNMDSLQRANFICELSEYISFDISVDSLENYRTVNELSRYLAGFCAVRDGLAQLKDDEKHQVLNMIGSDSFQKERFTLEEIPKQFYCFDEYLPYKALVQRNEMISGMGINPFFTEVLSINDNYITKKDGDFINFSSNNFLGLTNDFEVQSEAQQQINKFGTSVSASRLISGQNSLHKKLESKIATLLNVEDALVFVGAATANTSTIGHLFNKNDLILYDELSHESLAQGAKLSHASARPFKHNDYRDLELLLSKLRGRFEKILIFVEGLYSMDGDTPELREFIRIKKKYKAWLMVDECLSIGVLGQNGGGISEEQNIDMNDVDIWMGGLSKAFASCGGYIAGKKSLINYLKYTCPGFIFTTGISPANAAAASKAIDVISRDSSRVAALRKNTKLFLALARERKFNTGFCQGYSIVPIIVGDSKRCIEIYKGLIEDGINVQPIIYPAVAEGAARFRFSLTALHTEEQIKYTIDCIEKRMKNHRVSNNS